MASLDLDGGSDGHSANASAFRFSLRCQKLAVFQLQLSGGSRFKACLDFQISFFTYAVASIEVDSKQRGNCCDGSIVLPEEILQRIHLYPEALAFVFSGGDIGKLMIAV